MFSIRSNQRLSIIALAIFFILLLISQSPANAQVGYLDNNVDADSDQDSSSNRGSSGGTSYTDAQSFDASDEMITEQDFGRGEEKTDNWKYYKDIVVDQDQVTADLTNFPLLVSIIDPDLDTKAQSDGGDIAFFDNLGNQLAHEIELFDPAYDASNAQLIAWVKTDLSSSQDNLVWMKYGNSTMANQENPAAVWDGEYGGVWHLNEDPSGIAPQMFDSTSNDNDGTTANSPSQIAGKIDNGLGFDDTNARSVDVSSSPSLQLSSTIVVSAWIKTTDADSDVGLVVNKWGSPTNHRNYWLGKFDGSTFAFYVDDSQNVQIALTNINDGSWHHVVGIAEGSTMRLYVDGLQINTNSYSGSSREGSGILAIGRGAGEVLQEWNGQIDEVRVGNTLHSTDWISAQYSNQNSPNTFYSISQEYDSKNAWSNYKFINVNHHQISSDLSNFPLLVSILDEDIKRNAQSDGDDFAFFDINGIQLSHEIETYSPNYNATHAQLVAWVKSDLSSSIDTRLTMKYGNSTMTSQENISSVWNTNNAGVWHLQEDPPTSIPDSSSNSNDGTGSGSIATSAGKISNGIELTHTAGQEISIPNSASLTISDTLTVSAWIKPNAVNIWQTVISKSDGSLNSGSTTNHDLYFVIDAGGNYFISLTGSSGTSDWLTSFDAFVDTWQQLTFTYDSTSSIGTLYINGKFVGTNNFGSGTLNTNSNPFYIGYNRVYTNEVFDGVIDEVKFSNIVKTADWIETEYNNQNNPDLFLSKTNEFYYNEPWNYYKSITIDNTKVTGDVNDFPIYLTIIDEDLKTKAQTDGDDIAFFDNSGNQLAHELMSYNPNYSGTEAQLVVWIKSDLSSTVDTEITMKYGESSIGSQENPTAVWSNNYNNVWHLEEDPSTTAPQIIDSTYNNMGTSLGSMTSNDQVSGKLDGSLDFDGDPIIANGDQIDVGNLDSNAWTAVTMEAWVYKHDNGDDRVFSVAPTTASADSRFALLMNSANFATRIGTDGVGGTVSSTITGGAYTINTWYHFVATWDATSEMIYIYVDGLQTGSAAKDGDTISDTTVSGLIGNAAVNDNRFFDGIIDEVRVSHSARSPEWIQTEFNNQDNPSTFYSVGSEFLLDESDPATSLQRTFEDPVDNPISNLDGYDNKGTHSDFNNQEDKDGVFNTVTETAPNTHSLSSSGRSGRMNVGGGSADWRSTQGTISFWIRFTTIGGDRPWGLGGNMEFDTYLTNQFTFDWGAEDIVITSAFSINTWYFFAITWNEHTNTFVFYYGDESTAPTVDATTTGWTGSVTGVTLGTNTFLGSNNGAEIDGFGDDLRYWDIDRSISDIQSDYNTPLNGTENHLRSYFPLDNSYQDKGPDKNHGTQVNSPIFSSATVPTYATMALKLDLEFQFLTVPQGTTVELGIYTGTVDAEDLLVDYWDGDSWENLFLTLSANSWNNISITNFVTTNVFTLRYRDGTRSSDTNQDSWEIDAVILTYSNFELEWEHQVQSVDLARENYKLTIFGSSSDSSESFQIQMWDQVASDWKTPFGTKIGSTEQWYNYTISDPNIIGSTITWRYRGDNETRDNVQNTLNIDYAGIAVYDEVPVFDSSPGPLQYDEGVGGNSLSWDLTDDNPNRYTLFRDEVNITSGSWNNPSAITINGAFIDGLLMGTYTYKIMATDVNGNHANDSVLVTVVDGTDPTISSPSDLQYSEGQIGNELNWTASDNYFDNYEIYNDTDLIQSGSWSNGNNITLNIDGLLKGLYNYTITVYDTSGNNAIDNVQVIVVDTTMPDIDHPADIVYSEGSPNNEINWIATDSYADSYEIWNSTNQITSGSWTSGVNIVYDIDGLLQGSYNFTIIVYDASGNSAFDTVLVNVFDGTPPTIDSPSDIFGYSEETTGNTIDWLPSDGDPAYYEIYIDELLNETSPSWTSDVTLTVNIDGLLKGTRNITIVIYDSTGNFVSDTVLVTVIDTIAPTFNNPLPPDYQYNEFSSGNEIDWLFSDNYPNTFEIYLDDGLLFSSSWKSGGMTLNVDNLGLGIHNYTIVIFDKSSLQSRDTVLITVVDGTSPSIDQPIDITYAKNSEGNFIEWIGTDAHPDYYTISNDTHQLETGDWISGAPITINIDGLDVGLFNFTITIFDETGFQNSDTLAVAITAESVFLSAPDNTYYVYGSTGNELVWIVSDANPANYSIYQDGNENATGTWTSGNPIIFDIDGLEIWEDYNFTIIVRDDDLNIITHQLNVTVSDMPDWDFYAVDVTYNEGTTGNTINWTGTDMFPDSYKIYINGSFYSGGGWNDLENISVNIDGLSVGLYNITIELFDTVNNTIYDSAWITVIDNIDPTLSTPLDIEYSEGPSYQEIIWIGSDVHQDYYEIWNTTDLITTDSWVLDGNIKYNISGLDRGVYNFTIVIFDTSGNSNSSTVIVTVIDSTPPEFINRVYDIQYAEGDPGKTISWNATDGYADIYEIWNTTDQITSGGWTSGVPIVFDIDGLKKGDYNFTIIFIDESNNRVINTVLFTVTDETNPVVTFPGNPTIDEDAPGETITWVGTDSYEDTYKIYRNGSAGSSIPWSTGANIILDLSVLDLNLGYHNFTIEISDLSGNLNYDTVIVRVVDGTDPTNTSPDDEQFSEGAISHTISWDVYDLHEDYYEIYNDVGLVKTGNWVENLNINYIVPSSLTKGVYNYTIYVYDESGNFVTDVVTITVLDTTLPVFVESESSYDLNYAEGDTGKSIIWHATDDYADRYEIWNSTHLNSTGTWNSGVDIEFDRDGLLKGSYNFTIIFFDESNNWINDTIIFTVTDETPPEITALESYIPYFEGTPIVNITWTISDNYPDYYEIYNGSTLMDSDTWPSGSFILYVNGSKIGIYEYRLILYDMSGNNASDTVLVQVKEIIAPNITTLPDLLTNETSVIGEVLSWTPTDIYPGAYTIEFDEVQILSGNWNDSEAIVLNLNSLFASSSKGSYNITIIFQDSSFNQAIDTVLVTILDISAPIITDTLAPADNGYTSGTTGNYINWTVTDSHPQNYFIYLDDVLNITDSWMDNIPISINIDGLSGGLHNYTIIIYDDSSNFTNRTIWIDVADYTAPDFFDSPVGQVREIIEGNSTSLLFNIIDENAANYTITRVDWNGENEISETFPYTSDVYDIVIVDSVGLDLGFYNYTVIAFDTLGNNATISFLLHVVDRIAPIYMSEAPNTSNYAEGSLGNTLTWKMTDNYAGSNTSRYNGEWRIYDNGTELNWDNYDTDGSNIWSQEVNETISIDGFASGTHIISFVIFDSGGNSLNSTIILTVYDKTNPEINSRPSTTSYNETTTGNTLIWNVNDIHSGYYNITLDGEWFAYAEWQNNENIIINIDGLESRMGLDVITYTFVIIFYDESMNNITDSWDIIVFDVIKPVINKEQEFEIFLIDVEGNVLEWEVYDQHPGTYLITRNGDFPKSGEWDNLNNITITIDGLNRGFYNFTIVISDASENSIIHSVIIRVKDPLIIDTLRPEIILETNVYEGDVEIFEDIWFNITGAPVTEATIITQLYYFAELKQQFVTETDEFGEYRIPFNYTELIAGEYTWILSFQKEGYQDWQDIRIIVNVLPHTYTVEFDLETEITEGESFPIVVKVRYANNNTKDTQLSLSELIPVGVNNGNKADGVLIQLEIELELRDGSIKRIIKNELTEAGVALFVLTSSETDEVIGVKSLKATILDTETKISVDFTLEANTSELPSVVPGSPDFITLILDFVENNVIVVPIIVLLLIAAGSLSVVYGRRSQDRAKQLNRDVKSAFVELKAIKSIQSIIIQNEAKATVYEEQVSETEMNTNLIGGMVTAFSSFLNELGKSDQSGFEMMEREGISITAHKGKSSIFIVISSEKLPFVMLNQIQRAQQAIESAFRSNFSRKGEVQTLTKKQVHPKFDLSSFKIALKYHLSFNSRNIRNLLNERSLSRALKQNIDFLSELPHTEHMSGSKISLEGIVEFYKSKGITERVSSRTIILAYQYNIFEAILEGN